MKFRFFLFFLILFFCENIFSSYSFFYKSIFFPDENDNTETPISIKRNLYLAPHISLSNIFCLNYYKKKYLQFLKLINEPVVIKFRYKKTKYYFCIYLDPNKLQKELLIGENNFKPTDVEADIKRKFEKSKINSTYTFPRNEDYASDSSDDEKEDDDEEKSKPCNLYEQNLPFGNLNIFEVNCKYNISEKKWGNPKK
jgi:hypothetical protein